MNPTRFDYVAREYASGGLSRRATLKALAVGGVAAFFGRHAADAEAAKGCGGRCAKRNWCEDRTHTCGPSGGYGKCLVRRFGGKNVCAEILFQADTCDDCKSPACADCVCILAAGGGDKCNNGASGLDYICARKI